jgi:type II secretory pathway pseudopilin PulG
MRLPFEHVRHRRAVKRGLTLVEAIISIVVIGVMLVAALNTVGASQTAQRKTADRQRGMLLAQDLMSEIFQQHFEDPGLAPGNFGLGADEVGDGSRALWDDVDDYNGWSASPPQSKDGTELSDLDGWRRSVSVAWATPGNFGAPAPGDTGVKQITVTVEYDDALAASLTAVRTRAWPGLSEMAFGTPDGGSSSATNRPPTAVAEAVPQTGPAPLLVVLRGDGSSDPDAGDTLTYSWDFGDGGTGSGIAVTHTYESGTYVATLTVSDGHGGTDTDTAEIKAVLLDG